MNKTKDEILEILRVGCDEILDKFDFDVFCKTEKQFKTEYRAMEALLNAALDDISAGQTLTIREDIGLKVFMTNKGVISMNYILTAYDYNLEELDYIKNDEDCSEEEDWTYFGC